MAGPVTKWNATIAMPVFASARASGEADKAQVGTVVENEREAAQGPQRDSFEIGTGALVAMGVAAVLGFAHLWRVRRLTAVSEHMSGSAGADLLQLISKNADAVYVMDRFATLDAQASNPLLGFEQEMFRSCLIALSCDLTAQDRIGNAGPAAFLMEYWKAKGQARNVRTMRKTLQAVSVNKLERAAAHHAYVAARLHNATSPLTAGDLLAKAIHETAAAQLYYRRGLYMVEGKGEVVENAGCMIKKAEETIVVLRGRWTTERWADNEVLRKLKRNNSLQRIQLLSMSVDELRRVIAREKNDMTSRKNEPGKWTVGPSGSTPQGRPPSRNTGSREPTGPMDAAFSSLRSFLGCQPSSPVQQYVHSLSFGMPMASIMSPRRW